jgi:hypothetical protein
MTVQETLAELQSQVTEVEKAANTFTEDTFFERAESGKWSVAENLEHLFLSAKPLVGLFGTPQIMAEKWPQANRPSQSYDELVALYLSKVGSMANAPNPTAPQNTEPTKSEQVVKYVFIHERFIERAEALHPEILDTYQVPHPLLGLLTIREFLYFTLYHNRHHKKAINKLSKS